jgi:hypothetical protein
MYAMFIDDERFPSSNAFWIGENENLTKVRMIIARSSIEAIHHFDVDGCPAFISFDHDLGGEDHAMKVVHDLIERDLNMEGNFIPKDFKYYVHSQNCVGVQNIRGLLDGYLEHKKRESCIWE